MEENNLQQNNEVSARDEFIDRFPAIDIVRKFMAFVGGFSMRILDTEPATAKKGELALIGGNLKYASAPDTWSGIGTYVTKAITAVSSGTVAEADLFSATIPGGTLGTNGILHLHGKFLVHGGSAQRYITIGVHYGASTSIYSASTKVLGYQQEGTLDMYMFADNSAGSQKILCEAFATEEAFSSTSIFRKSFTGTGGVDSSVDQTLRISVAWDATTTAPANSAELSYVLVTKIQ